MRGGLGFRAQSLPDLRQKWGVGTGQAGRGEFGVGEGRKGGNTGQAHVSSVARDEPWLLPPHLPTGQPWHPVGVSTC